MFSLSNLLQGGTLAELRESVAAGFRTIQTQGAVWNKEHVRDGTHGDVTATSVRTPRLRFRCRPEAWPAGDIFVVNASGGTGPYGLPLDVPEGVQFVSIIAPGGGTFAVYGIRQTNVQFGDLLFLRRDPRSASNIELQDRVVASVPVNTEIHVPQDSAISYPSFFIAGPCWTPLIYTPGAGTGNANAWGLFQVASA